MAPLQKEQSQSSRRILSVKLLATLVGVACLGVALLVFTPIYAASGSHAAQLKTSGGGCTSFTQGKSKVCVNAINGQAVTTATLNERTCPASVEINLFDRRGLVSSTKSSGCGDFKGPSIPLTAGNEYIAQVILDRTGISSPRLSVS